MVSAYSAPSSAPHTSRRRRWFRPGWCVLPVVSKHRSPFELSRATQVDAGLHSWVDAVGNVHGTVEVLPRSPVSSLMTSLTPIG